jgi:hypothetical protein
MLHSARACAVVDSLGSTLGPWLQVGVLFFGFVINALGRLLEVGTARVGI